MKRFVLQQLIEWKNREDRKPLILNGARQVGKTWLLHEFAKLEYKKEAYVVCRKNNLARQLFSQDFNVDRILRGLRAMTSVDITPGDTLIILDEIQDIPEALESLKYFKEEVPAYHLHNNIAEGDPYIYEDLSAFKLYMVDLGLMGAMVKTDPAQVLIKNDIFKEYKGGMTEQYVLQQMKSKGVSPIYYHNTDNSRLELDFVIQRNAQMVPIEVKAEGNVRANSLTALLGKRPELHAERFSMLPYKVQGNLTNFPLYAI